MATASRNTRKKARVRHNLTQAKKQARTLNAAYWQAHSTLLMILQQRGGQVTVTQGTMQQVLGNLRNLTWKSAPNPDVAGEIVITLVDETAKRDTGLSITRLPDEDDAAPVDDAVVDALIEQATGQEVV